MRRMGTQCDGWARAGLICAFLALPAAACATGTSAVPGVMRSYLAQREGDRAEALAALEQAIEADPESAALRIESARLLLGARRTDEALAAVDEGLERRPGHPELLLLRSRILEVSGRTEEAAEAALGAARAGGAREARGTAVRLLEGLGRREDALAEALRWVEADPRDADAWFAAGRLRLGTGDGEGARRDLGKALEIDPNHRPSLRSLAEMDEAAGNFTAAEALYRRVVDANPHDVEARFRLGQVLLKQERVEEAVDVFQAAERWSGGDPGLRFRLGMLLLQADRPADAEEVFRTVALAHGTDTQAWYLLGVSLLAQEKYQEALETLAHVPPEAVEYSDALVRRAIALEGLERMEEAKALLEARLAEHPDDEEVAVSLAGLWEDSGEHRRAVEMLEAFLEAHGSENPRVFFTLGVLHDKLGEWPRSVEYMKRALSINPYDPHALNYIGYTYAEHGVHLEEAEALILRALDMKPDDGFITDSLGWVYYKQGRFAEAVATLEKAVEVAPDDPVIWEHLGDARRAAGETERARQAYERTLELAPDTESAKRKLGEL